MPEYLRLITLPFITKAFFCAFLLLTVGGEASAQQVHTFGIFTGFNLPGTIDTGINKDPRYRTRYAFKITPIGLHYGIDIDNIGFSFDPYVFRTGQNYFVINTFGGQLGERNINLDYIRVPLTFKVHLMDASYLSINFVTSAGLGILIGGKETISHRSGLMYFPQQVYPILPPEYVVTADGVQVPGVNEKTIVTKEDFKPLMIFGSAGIRSDWAKKEDFLLSVDMRLNYGFTDPRTTGYTTKVKAFQAIYDLYGKRRELFFTMTVGISKVIHRASAQDRLRYKRKKTRDWRAPTMEKPKRNKNDTK